MTALTHTQILLILAICLVPAISQLIQRGSIHALWVGLAVTAGIFAVVAW